MSLRLTLSSISSITINYIYQVYYLIPKIKNKVKTFWKDKEFTQLKPFWLKFVCSISRN